MIFLINPARPVILWIGANVRESRGAGVWLLPYWSVIVHNSGEFMVRRKRQPPNSTLFVGDIQGCAAALERLLKASGFNPDRHHLLPVGDTINRGPDNVRTLEVLHSVGAEPILGNHEMALLWALEQAKTPHWLSEQSVSRDLLRHRRVDRYLDWIQSWPVWVWGSDWVAVHGGLHPRLPIEETDPRYLMTVRLCDAAGNKPAGWDTSSTQYPDGFRPWHHYYRGAELVIYGHWARQGLTQKKRSVGLDSGCVYGGCLTGMWYPSREIVQVSS